MVRTSNEHSLATFAATLLEVASTSHYENGKEHTLKIASRNWNNWLCIHISDDEAKWLNEEHSIELGSKANERLTPKPQP